MASEAWVPADRERERRAFFITILFCLWELGCYSSAEFPTSQRKNADVERNERMRGWPHSKIPSIFDHIVRNSSAIESYYQRFNDHLLTCFIHLVKQYSDEAKATAKRAVYEYLGTRNHDLPKAGEVLKLFTAEYEHTTPFWNVQEQAFTLLDRQRLTRVAEYMVNEVSCDEIAFEWEHIDSMARRFKQHLRPLLRAIDLSATRVNAPIQEAIHFLKTAFQKDRSLHQIASGDFPTDFFPVREKRYLYQRNETGQKPIICCLSNITSLF